MQVICLYCFYSRGTCQCLLHCTLSCGAVYCNRPPLSVFVFVCGSITTTTRNCVHPSSPNWVFKVRVVTISSCFFSIPRPQEGSEAGQFFLPSPYYSQRAMFASPLEHFFIEHCDNKCIPLVKLTVTPATRSSADADNGLDAFSSQSRSTNMVPFWVHCDFSLSM